MQPLLSCSFLMANTPLGWGWKVKAVTSVFAFAMLCSQFVIQDERNESHKLAASNITLYV